MAEEHGFKGSARLAAILLLALTTACGGNGHNPVCGDKVGDPCFQPGIGDCCPDAGLVCHVDPVGGPGPGPGSIDYTCQAPK